jgi:hypothetical protein
MEEFTSLLSISSVGTTTEFYWRGDWRCSGRGIHCCLYGDVYGSAGTHPRNRNIEIARCVLAADPQHAIKGNTSFACLGVLAGILLTYGTQWTIAHLVPSSLNQETVYAWWPLAAAIAGALLGAIVPITKAVRQDVTDALAYE